MDLHGFDAEADIVRAANAAGLCVAPDEGNALAAHVRMVYEARGALSLTTIPEREAATLHVVDSLLGMPAMREGPDGPWADLGSGAGFPGVPLCICGHRHTDLLESVGKKARFLETVKACLRLDVTVRALRAEDAARESPEAYSAVSARAVGALAELAELASPLLLRGGVLVAWKGALGDEELLRGDRAARIVGLSEGNVLEYRLPGSDARRRLVVFRKVRESEVALPRRAGLAHRRPLG